MNRISVISILERINQSPVVGSGSFVGAVYDNASPEGDYMVALIVGINYGQHSSSSGSIDRCEDMVGYARHAEAIAAGKRHTVLWNFFPFLTESEWVEDIINAADEAERVFERGYAAPFAIFQELCESLQPDPIIFHGITSAVPILARTALRLTRRQAFLVPNLSRGLVKSRVKLIS